VARWTFTQAIGFHAPKNANHSTIANKPSAEEIALKYATSLLGDARAEIDRADAKASILLAASGVAAGALLAGLIAGTWSPLRLQAAIQWAWWLGVAESAIGICCLALVVYPREPKHDSGLPWAVVYYGDVRLHVTTSELVQSLKHSAATNLDRAADQLRFISSIVHSKYRLIRWGMRLLFVGSLTVSASVLVNVLLSNH
jgi:hypothetical protein